MPRKRYTSEQIISKLREAEVELSRGKKVPQVCRQLGVTEQTYYRWRKAVVQIRAQLGEHRVSERRACKVLGQTRSTQRRRARRLYVQGSAVPTLNAYRILERTSLTPWCPSKGSVGWLPLSACQ